MYQTLLLNFEASGLPNMDKKSKTDPMVVLFEITNGQRIEIGKTGVLLDDLNPKWTEVIEA